MTKSYAVAPQIGADVVLVRALVGDLDAEPDRHAAVGPALRGVAHLAFSFAEGRVGEGRAGAGRSRRGR